ncbi:MAG: hypothetical protein HYV32_00960 [Candidatus Kerfeldbacteria bacterium]|nr:hypothetical protein [Candidatus Kerfeldbacteria bacterium]
MRKRPTHSPSGSALLMTLFFSSLFLIMFGATLSFIMVQHKAVAYEVYRAQGTSIAEAGTNYYRWHLAHDPEDFTTDTGTHHYTDPYGGVFGTYTLTVEAPTSGQTTAVITSAGSPQESPNVESRIRVRYGKQSLTEYAFLTNSNVWFGSTEKIKGKIHSNGGIRMDGISDSLVTSAVESYICGPEQGCTNEVKPGVWGSGENPKFWKYPVQTVDFHSFSVDLENLKNEAIAGGIYLGDSGSYGYFLEFHNKGTLTISSVTTVYPAVNAYDGTSWITVANDKKTWTALSGYTNIPLPSNGLIFLEDDTWVSGVVTGHATVVAARLPDGSYPWADIYIPNSLNYTGHDGADELGVIAQDDVLIPLRSDDTLDLNGAILAINGHVMRYYYSQSKKDPYKTYALRDTIKIYGSIISNGFWTWSWVSSDTGPVTSGYNYTDTKYDPNLTYNPPPYFPTENEYSFISWEELERNQE